MSATQLVTMLLEFGQQTEPVGEAAQQIVRTLLGDEPLADSCITEATVNRPQRGQIWVASFTGPEGGQVWRSTGLTDHDQALIVARKWEAEARAQRTRMGRSPRKPTVHLQQREPGNEHGLLTQREVGLLLGISQRSVRRLERRAIEKLRRHPMLRDIWQQYLAGELEEGQVVLTRAEVQALLGLARTQEEQLLIQELLRLIQRP